MIALLLLAADVPKDAHRPAVERLQLSGDSQVVATCAVRELNRSGRATQIVTPNGMAIDWVMTIPLAAASGSAYITMNFDYSAKTIGVLYRHPLSAKSAQSIIRNVAKRCFKDDWNAWASTHGGKVI